MLFHESADVDGSRTAGAVIGVRRQGEGILDIVAPIDGLPGTSLVWKDYA
jgi:hypothetical protein